MDVSPRLSGDEWQDWTDKLLKRHYGPGEYQSVPDKDRGDAGIEGFTISNGHAYQAYGPEDEPLSTNERYEKQRNKITTDINKFINNRAFLSGLFGNIKISRWILLVPSYDSKEIVRHAAKKTDEVLAAKLPYVTDDFRVCIEDENAFSVERDQLLRSNSSTIVISADDVSDDRVREWLDKNDGLVKVVDDKASRLSTLVTKEDRLNFRNNIIRAYLTGQNFLGELRKYPMAFEALRKIKSDKERYLSLEICTISSANSDILAKSLANIRDSAYKVPGVSDSIIEAIAWEAVADWIIRCPLDFPHR